MREKRFSMMPVIVFCFIFPFISKAQTWNVSSDYWTATDALGRKTPAQSEAGPPKSGKYVGIFYWTWHTDFNADFSPVLNITQILNRYPEAANDLNHPAWRGIVNGGVFWWDESLFGYYRTTDHWVLRKHAQMLADAGIDVVFFDCTNGTFTWKSSYTELAKVWDQAGRDGVKTPKIAFLLNFAPTETSLAEIAELYNDLYQPGLYKDLWFMWHGKPLIMAYPEMLIAKYNTAGLKFTVDSTFVAVDASCPSWSNNIGNLTLKLYKWKTNYEITVADAPIAEKMFINFNDNARLRLTFGPQPPGVYFWQLSEAAEIVGVWKWNHINDPVVSYFNGKMVADGNYDSKIYYGGGTVRNLTHDNGSGHTPVQIPPSIDSALVANMKNFFTFRPGQPDYVSGPSRNDQWGWLENYPQHGYGKKPDGRFEEVPVGVAQNAYDASGGHASAFNMPGTYGRSYTQSKGQDTRPEAFLYGLNFQEQWSRAFKLNPDLVFVTGWNEWIAGLWTNWPNPYAPFSFVDEYSREKSRDIEPVKSWGAKADVYYLQLVSNVRMFKGMRQQEPASHPVTIDMGKFDDWTDIKPAYRDYKGDTMWRNARGQGNQLVYINNTGRNDIVLAKVARDSEYIYFYVETADNLTPRTDPRWMLLFIDIDRDKATGWEGYDYVINRIVPGDSVVIEKSVSGWNWTKIGAAEYAVAEKELELKVKRSLLNVGGKKLDFEFKWSDNMQGDGDIMDFYVNGDAAPEGRFNFIYSVQNVTGINEATELPKSFLLTQNYPNPFNLSTRFAYSTPIPGHVTIDIYNVMSRKVRSLIDRHLLAGTYTATWDARDDQGAVMPSGEYFYKIESGRFNAVKKMVLLK